VSAGTGAAAEDVAAANEAFYAAVEVGDLDRLRDSCCRDRELVCVHPGAEPIHGTGAVLRSWALIMANTDYIQFFLTDVSVNVSGDVAAVTCTENILTAQDEPPDQQSAGFQGGKAQALNVFTREEGGWRMWIHQASPVGSAGYE
jgi:ketosteroid isomerase-like protein